MTVHGLSDSCQDLDSFPLTEKEPDNRIYLINYLQSKKRSSNLTDSDRDKIEETLNKKIDSSERAALLALLDRKSEAKKALGELDDMSGFLSYPIGRYFRFSET